MKNVDLRKTYCRLDSEHIEQYKKLIREQGLVSIITKEGIDDMKMHHLIACVDADRKIHSDKVDWCKGNHYTEFTGIKEEYDNKHPHHDSIVEWAKDTSKSLQCYMENAEMWVECYINPVISDTTNDYKFRIKPEREFIKGHWYPCVTNNDVNRICKYKGENMFYFSSCQSGKEGYPLSKMKWVGESLGEIKFPEEEDRV